MIKKELLDNIYYPPRYINIGEKYEEQFMQNGFECVQNQVVLTNSSAKVLKEEMTKPSYITLSNFLPTTPATLQWPRSRSNRNTNTSSIVKSIQKGVGKNET